MLTPDFTFLHSCTVRPWLRQGVEGPVYGDATAYRCRVELGERKARPHGAAQEVVAAGTIFFPSGARFPPESQITFDGRTFSALSVEPIYGFFETHVEVAVL